MTNPSTPRRIGPRTAALLLGSALALLASGFADPAPAGGIFARDNLIAWCIVPFDSKHRGPEERAAMLRKLGFEHFAYDWRPEHVATFDAEIDALRRHGVALDAFWVAPGELNRESRLILETLHRHGVLGSLWALIDVGNGPADAAEQARRVAAAVAKLRPLAEEAAKVGCGVDLYNHGGWFGEPDNQIAIIRELNKQGVANVGMVYNLHHGHEHLDGFAERLKRMLPYLKTLNLNGMDPGGDRVGRKILPLGQGSEDLKLLRIIRDCGYRGPIGILGHTEDDAEARLRDNLDGLDWLVPQLDGAAPGPRPVPRTPVAPRPAPKKADAAPPPGDPAAIAALLADARGGGDARLGAAVFASAKHACLTCHRVAGQGGNIGPDLTASGLCLKPEEVVESILWPKLKLKEGYEAVAVATHDGRVRQGYPQRDEAGALVLRDPASGDISRIDRTEIESTQAVGTLMPEGLLEAMTPGERRDLVRFLIDNGRAGSTGLGELVHNAHAPAQFRPDRAPLDPSRTPDWQHPVNRDRIYDFYAKEAEAFAAKPVLPLLLPAFPGLDGGKLGHWGNQNEGSWADGRWNRTDLGTLLSGVFRGAGVTVPKGVCVRLGDRGELSACFNPETLCYEAAWTGGFVRFAPTRHGFLDGLILDGTPQPRPAGSKPDQPFTYRGFYRHGHRVVFAYNLGGVEMLDAPWVDAEGHFSRTVAPLADHPLAPWTKGGPGRYPQVLETAGSVGQHGPYAIDTITPPFDNPWNALLFFGDHDFLPDGSAMLCTMQGDVWHVTGLDADLQHVRWRRFATGLHQALGLVVSGGEAYVLGRDQITRLRDLDGDGEADFHECFSNAFKTSPAGHDFLCGLQRDAQGRFYAASGPEGLIRIAADGRTSVTLATGFRNPDGLGLGPDGTLTVPSSEGEWVPASTVSEIRPGGHYGYRGPKGDQAPDLPLAYLPRGLDNSSGGQVFAASDRFGPLSNQWIHLSFGAGSAFLLLRDQVDGQPQGAVVPLPGSFASGVHRGRMNPADGQLYASGMTGWGSYTPLDGCFQRVRFTGEPAQVPLAVQAHEDGVLIRFSLPLDPRVAAGPASHFAQAWNYRYGPGYGSEELSPSHPGVVGHDPWPVRSVRLLDDGRSLFLAIPALQPVNQLHLHLKTNPASPPIDLFATIHRLAPPFDPSAPTKAIAAHPILADLIALKTKPTPNPWATPIPNARPIRIEAGKNLSYLPRSFTVRAGEPIELTFANPDVVPHNWALIRPGTLATVGDLANKLISRPDAVARQYIPRGDEVLAYTDITEPDKKAVIHFKAPATPGRYPFVCSFPGHWMVMNGEMIVE